MIEALIETLTQQINALKLELPLYSFIIAANLLTIFVSYGRMQKDMTIQKVFRESVVELLYLFLVGSTALLIFSVAVNSKTLGIVGIVLITFCYLLVAGKFLYLLGLRGRKGVIKESIKGEQIQKK